MPPFDRVRGKGLRRRRRTGEAWAVQAFPPRFLLPGHQAVLGVPLRRAGLRMVTPAGPRSAIDGRTRRQPYFSEAGWIPFPLRGHRACADTMTPCRRAFVRQRHARLSRERQEARRPPNRRAVFSGPVHGGEAPTVTGDEMSKLALSRRRVSDGVARSAHAARPATTAAAPGMPRYLEGPPDAVAQPTAASAVASAAIADRVMSNASCPACAAGVPCAACGKGIEHSEGKPAPPSGGRRPESL
jgi:hypothetical protein